MHGALAKSDPGLPSSLAMPTKAVTCEIANLTCGIVTCDRFERSVSMRMRMPNRGERLAEYLPNASTPASWTAFELPKT